MKFLVKATLPVESGNALVKDPNMQQRMDTVMGDIRPEAVYFTIEDGQRTVYFVVEVGGIEDMPRVAEPLWLSWKANVTFLPAFTPEDMDKTMHVIEEVAKKY